MKILRVGQPGTWIGLAAAAMLAGGLPACATNGGAEQMGQIDQRLEGIERRLDSLEERVASAEQSAEQAARSAESAQQAAQRAASRAEDAERRAGAMFEKSVTK